MNTGIFGEGFPYSNFHDLNMDWIIKIAKDFLDQYTHLQETITNGETSITELTTEKLDLLQDTYEELAGLLQQWYDTHSADIATQLASAIQTFNTRANAIGAGVIESIPDDYTELVRNVNTKAKQIEYLNKQLGGAIGPFDMAHLGYWIGSDGTVSVAEGWGYSDSYYAVSPNTTYICSKVATARISQYDSSKQFISNSIVTTHFTTSATTYYIKVSLAENDWADTFYCNTGFNYNYGLIALRKANNLCKIVDNADYSLMEFNDSNKWINSSGNIEPASGWGYSETYYEVDGGNTYYFYTKAGTIAVATYNANYEFIQRATVVDSYLTFTSSVKYIRISCGIAEAPYIRVTKGHPSLTTLRSVVSIGSGKEYTSLREGIRVAVQRGDTDVYIYAGQYDLTTEFATEITAEAETPCGIYLGNGVHLHFLQGSHVYANFNSNNTWAMQWFSPFYSWQNDTKGFTIEGLAITTQNTHYIVHDERFGSGEYTNKYINCFMQHETVQANAYRACIGGGLGEKCRIIIESGVYTVSVDGLTSSEVYAITYHNGNSANCDNQITIKDLFLVGRFAFGYYGTSQRKSWVLVSNCSMTGNIWKHAETEQSTTDNIEVYQWNNVVRS